MAFGVGGDQQSASGGRRNPYVRGRSGGMFSWAWVILGVACGVMLIVLGIRGQQVVDAAVGFGLVALCILLCRPVRQELARRWAKARWEHPDTDAPVVIYWRADDLHSLKLRSKLKGVRDRAVWVNLFWWGDAEGTVRIANGGDELLPFVMINSVPHVDPIADLVRQALEDLPDRPQGRRRKGVAA